MTSTSQTSQGQLVQVFRSPREEGLYLYVDRKEGLSRVPDTLLQRFGTPESALLLTLTPDRTLARADATKVLEAIREQGFYLQLPPRPDPDMLQIRLQNTQLQ